MTGSSYPKYWNEKIETMDPKEMVLLQEKKLQKQIDYVYNNSPFYQKKFKEAGVRPEHIRTLRDLEKIPLTIKDELRKSQENYPPFGDYLAVERERIARIHTSSGTTGKPPYQACTKKDIETTWNEAQARLSWCSGMRPGDIYMMGMMMGWVSPTTAFQDALRLMNVTFVPAGTGATDDFIRVSNEVGATITVMTPSYAVYLAEVVRNKFNMDPGKIGNYRIIICGAEPGLTSVRENIEESWKVKAYNQCGNSDVFTVLWAECEEQDGMHNLVQDFVLSQLVDPETGEIIDIEKGAEGALCYTNLDREAMPLVRFNCEDKLKILQTEKCKCGRTAFKAEVIDRYDNMLIIKGLNVFPSAIQDIVVRFKPQTTGALQILKREPGPRVEGRLDVEVEYSKETGSEEIENLEKKITEKIQSILLFRPKIIMKPEGTLPRFEYKAKLIKKLYE